MKSVGGRPDMTKKFWKGMLIGAAIGAAASLLDRETRQAVIRTSKKTVELIKHPEEVTKKVREGMEQARTTIEQVVEDIQFFTGKMNELKETTPQMLEIVKDVKNAFEKQKGEDEIIE
jgi:gas vesicle protein